MQLYTPVSIAPLPHPIGLSDNIVLLGSCFSENIGKQLQIHKQKASINPFGTIFNPVSLAKLISWAMGASELSEQLIVEQQGVFKHFLLHSNSYAYSRQDLIQQLEKLRSTARQMLEDSQYLILTLGTAWVYEHRATASIVANCHKAPSSLFEKRLLSIAEIKGAFATIQSHLPNTKLLLTLSPVRHLKDTLPLNAVSKSTLRLAIHEWVEEHTTAYYFPSYELMMDELRDYRFYKDDLLHPNSMGIAYIWEKFLSYCLDEEAQAFIKQWKKIQQSINHRSLTPKSPAHQNFLLKLLKKLKSIQQVDVSQEIKEVEGRIVYI